MTASASPDPVTPLAARPRRGSTAERMDVWLDAAGGPVPALAAGWLAALVLVSLQSPLHGWLMALGFAGSFGAGLVGLGGAVVMVPLLLFVPRHVGLVPLGMHTIAGVTMVQVAVAGTIGMLAHRRSGYVNGSVVATLGGGLMAGSFAGGLCSRFVPAALLEGVFALLAAVAALTLLAGRRGTTAEAPAGDPHFNKALGVVSGLSVGLLVGMVGTAGGFVLIPLMISVLGIPVRVAMGSSLAIVALGGLSGSVGKIVTGQVDWPLALALVCGALPGAQFGASLSHRVPATALARLLGALLTAVAVKMWWDVLAGR